MRAPVRGTAAPPWFQTTSGRPAMASAARRAGPLPYGPKARSAARARPGRRRADSAGSERSSSIRRRAPQPTAQARSPAAAWRPNGA